MRLHSSVNSNKFLKVGFFWAEVYKYLAVSILIKWSSDLRHLGQSSVSEEFKLIKKG